jgi:hypothetical protein
LVATGGYLLNIGLYAQQDAEPKNIMLGVLILVSTDMRASLHVLGSEFIPLAPSSTGSISDNFLANSIPSLPSSNIFSCLLLFFFQIFR